MSKSHRPHEEEKPTRRSWRGGGGSGGNGAPRGPAASYGWRQGRATGNYAARKWLIGVPMILGVLGLFVLAYYVINRLPTPTPLVCVLVTDYEPPFEPQAFAQEDVEQLQRLFTPQFAADSVAVPDAQSVVVSTASDKAAFLAEMKEAVGRQQPGPGKPVLVYISAQGLVSREGQPCLVTAADRSQALPEVGIPSQLLASSRLLPVEELVDALAEYSSAEHPVILLLDAVRWDRNWRLGIVANDFASELGKIDLGKTGRENIVIVNSTTSDEVSSGEIGLVDLRRGLSLFGECVARGLGGAADTNGDSVITLAEFESFLATHMQAAAARRGRIQRPSVWTKLSRADLRLASADAARSQKADAQIDAVRFAVNQDWLNEIHAGFATLARWQERREAGEFAPAATLLLEEAQRQHWQAELQRCLAGKAYVNSDASFELPPAAQLPPMSLESDVIWQAAAAVVPPATDGRPVPPSYSLPLALGSLTLSEAQQQRGRSALNAPPAAPMPADPSPAAKEPKASAAEVAWAAWDYCLSAGPLSPNQQANLDRYLGQHGFLMPVELRTLNRFSDRNPYLPDRVKQAGGDLSQVWAMRQAAERAAYVAGEPRVLPLLVARLNQYDSQRRRVEDRLFIDSGKIESDSLAGVASLFSGLETESSAAAAAMGHRDRALADVPYLLEWAIVGGNERVTQASQLLAAIAELRKALDAPPADAMQPVDWAALGGAIAAAHESLAATYRDQWKANVGESPPGGYLGQFQALERLLSTPLDHLTERQDLWSVYWKVIESGELEPTTGSDAFNFDPEAAATIRKMEQGAAQQLLGEWLAAIQASEPALPTFDALADRAASDLAPFTGEALPTDLAQQLARREPTCRAAASWLTLRPGGPLLAVNSIQQHAEHAAYDYYVWQAQRALDDFHGSGDLIPASEDEPIGTNQPPFALAAAALLTFAERSYFPHAPVAPQRDLLSGRMSDARRLADVTLRWPARPLSTGQTDLVVERWPKEVGVKSLPAGEAALRIAGDWQRVLSNQSPPPLGSPAQWLAAVKADDANWPASLKFFLPAEQPSVTPVVTYYYRGHAVRLSQPIRRLAPLYVIDSPSPGPTGKLTVQPKLSKAHVVIVLDCSASMASWMGEANQAVRTVIDRLLLKADDVQVSLVLFAHRRSKDSTLAGTTVTWGWNGKFGMADPTVTLFNDHQVVWRSAQGISKLDPIIGQADGKGASDAQAQATGLTPLFSSLAFALADGFQDDDPASRHLVIISDGDDFVQEQAAWNQRFLDENKGALAAAKALLPKLTFVPPWPKEELAYNSDENRLLRADLVKKGIDARKPNVYLFDLSKANELAEAARLAGLGKPIAVQTPTDLANAVLRQMGVLDYTLDDQDEGTDLSGRTTQTKTFADLPIGSYTLRLSGQADSAAPLRIGGGEALEVAVATGASRPRFEFQQHEPPLLDAAARGRIPLGDVAIDPALGTRLKAYDVQCRAERAQKGSANADRCTFELVFQNAAGKDFTPRPVELWVEIAPEGSTTPVGSYVFCNPFALKGTRSPVYELVAPKWPEAADRAKISVWVRMQPTQSRDAVVDVSFTTPKHLSESAAEPGVQFQFEALPHPQGALVKITELFRQGASAGAWHFVTPTPNLGVSRATRTYYDGQVEHQFIFSVGNVEDAEQRKFVAMPIAAWKKLALGLEGDQPLSVRVPD